MTSAAWVLGEVHAKASACDRGGDATRCASAVGCAPRARRRRDSDSLPVVLEFASDPDPMVRREKRFEAAAALLDPAKPDGRATEPLSAALRNAGLGAAERAAIARLLGRTGAARAAPVLAGLARAKGAVVRLAAIDALGTLGPVAATRPENLAPLVDALGDTDPGVRLHAAVALADAGDARVRDAVLREARRGRDRPRRRAPRRSGDPVAGPLPTQRSRGSRASWRSPPGRSVMPWPRPWGARTLPRPSMPSCLSRRALTPMTRGPRRPSSLRIRDDPRALAATRKLLAHSDAFGARAGGVGPRLPGGCRRHRRAHGARPRRR